VEEYSKREQELREQLRERDAKDEDFKRVTGELERRLEDVEKYRAHCDELQRRLDDNLDDNLDRPTREPSQDMDSSYQVQMHRLEEEKRVLAELAARATTDKENVMVIFLGTLPVSLLGALQVLRQELNASTKMDLSAYLDL